eukprot:gnl/TRDRNA2_/TRDRNA2_171988_c5_seq2.p1 gnl/TRDRNA2_/TRDRNA2_171988_c5~~gnl/TRDRNA2_/TRDRNA2_171988_c5_seq2.p1  ORF type:complete len:216 (+),score=26.58 gnl/TRDRNA2_/TRDRNA2_171988_c5_seq2:28-648(+)
MNPEILVMNKPLAHFDPVHASRVLALLREFVSCRGVAKPVEEVALHRPRTCIYSTANLRGLQVSDMVLHVADGSVKQVNTVRLRQLESQAKQLFVMLDGDGDDKVTRAEFVAKGQDLPVEFWSAIFQVKRDCLTTELGLSRELGAAFDEADHDKSGEVTFEELKHLILQRQIHGSTMLVEEAPPEWRIEPTYEAPAVPKSCMPCLS